MCCGPTSTAGGSSCRQRSKASGQRVWKRQPFGTRAALGTSPCSAGNSTRPALAPTCGVALRNATVYGWRGLNVISSARADLNQFSKIQDGNSVGDQPGKRQVVGDEQQRHVVLGAQVNQDLKNLSAYRDIEHRYWLIGDDEFRPNGKRTGNHHPLALPARQLVREAGEEIAGRIEPGGRKRFTHPVGELSRIARPAAATSMAPPRYQTRCVAG